MVSSLSVFKTVFVTWTATYTLSVTKVVPSVFSGCSGTMATSSSIAKACSTLPVSLGCTYSKPAPKWSEPTRARCANTV